MHLLLRLLLLMHLLFLSPSTPERKGGVNNVCSSDLEQLTRKRYNTTKCTYETADTRTQLFVRGRTSRANTIQENP